MRVLLRLPLRQTQGFIQSLLDLMVGLGDAGLLDLVASSRVFGGGVAEKADRSPGSPDALGGGFDRLEGLWRGRVESSTRLDQTADLAQTAWGVHEATEEVAQTLTRIDDASQVAPLLTQVDEAVGAVGGEVRMTTEGFRRLGHAAEWSRFGSRCAKTLRSNSMAIVRHPRWRGMRSFPFDSAEAWKQASGYHRRSLAETQIYR